MEGWKKFSGRFLERIILPGKVLPRGRPLYWYGTVRCGTAGIMWYVSVVV